MKSKKDFKNEFQWLCYLKKVKKEMLKYEGQITEEIDSKKEGKIYWSDFVD